MTEFFYNFVYDQDTFTATMAFICLVIMPIFGVFIMLKSELEGREK